MPDWSELQIEFDSLREDLRFYRLDYQWGIAGVHYRLAGGGVNDASRRFEVLASIAGQKLSELPEGALHDEVVKVADPKSRWYETLRYHSGAFEFGFVGRGVNDENVNTGNIYTGTLNRPADSSALICLNFSSLPIETTPSRANSENTIWACVNSYLKREAEHRGYLWLVISFIITIIIALIA